MNGQFDTFFGMFFLLHHHSYNLMYIQIDKNDNEKSRVDKLHLHSMNFVVCMLILNEFKFSNEYAGQTLRYYTEFKFFFLLFEIFLNSNNLFLF